MEENGDILKQLKNEWKLNFKKACVEFISKSTLRIAKSMGVLRDDSFFLDFFSEESLSFKKREQWTFLQSHWWICSSIR